MKKEHILKSQLYDSRNRIIKFCMALLIVLAAFKTNNLYSQISYTFTSCGGTGSLGPTPLQVTNTYSNTNLSGMVTSTAGIQYWTVPSTGGYRIEALGAKGYGPNAGRGASIAGDFTLTAGQVIKIVVGQQGVLNANTSYSHQFGGGGGSFVTYTNNTALIVAGGGGGSWSQTQNTNSDGTVAINGNPGVNGPTNGSGGINGNGGTSGSSGDGGGGINTNGGGTAGGFSFLNGASGGALRGVGGFGGGGGTSGFNNRRSGGGGGYSGGGGAGSSLSVYPEGGGGGSYNNGINQTNTSGVNTGQGMVIITELCKLELSSSATNSLNPIICSGNSLTLTTNGIGSYAWSNGNTTTSTIVVTPSTTTVYSVSAMSPSNCIAAASITVVVSAGLPTLSVVSSTNQTCIGKSATLTASGALTYTWSNNVVNGVSFNPTVTTTYSVIGENGCGTVTALSTISVAPLAVGLSITPTLVCAGSVATLSVTAAANSYTWLPTNVTNNLSSLLVSPFVNTTYSVAATDGTCAGTATVAISVDPIPTIIATPAFTQVCEGDAVVLGASGGLNYTWTPGNLSGTTVTVNPTSSTGYSVTGDNTFGCLSGTSAVVVTVANPTVTTQASSYFICKATTVTLTAHGATSYTWSGGPTGSVTAENPGITTVYSVTGEANGCFNTQTVVVDVFDPTLTVNGPGLVCEGATTTLSASGANTYSWQPGGLLGQVITVIPVTATIYTVSAFVTSTNNISCPATETLQLGLKPNPTITAVPDRSVICRSETTTITATGAATYTWTGGSVGQDIVVTSSLITVLNFSVTGTGINGCTDDANVFIVVNSCNSLNERAAKSDRLRLYPNPAKDKFTLESDEELNLVLINELGQVLYKFELNQSNGYKVQVSGLSKGIYFVIGQDSLLKYNQKILISN